MVNDLKYLLEETEKQIRHHTRKVKYVTEEDNSSEEYYNDELDDTKTKKL